MSSNTAVDRFSLVGEAVLLADGRSYDVGQIAPEFIILQTAADIPPGPATLVIRVDDEEMRRDITLPHGANRSSDRVVIERPERPSSD